MKKILCVLLAFLMSFSVVSVNIHAEEETPETEITETSETTEEEIEEEIEEEVSEEIEEEPVEESEEESEEDSEEIPETEQENEEPSEETEEEVVEEEVTEEETTEEENTEETEEEPEEMEEDPFLVTTFRTSSDYMSETIALSESAQLIHAGKYADYTKTTGIDVCEYQGTIDWQKVKNAGMGYALIRVGYRGWSSGKLVEDASFESNLSGALSAGLKVGLYFFSEAITVEEAKEEAQFVLDRIKGSSISLPVFIDQEFLNNKEDRLYTAELSKDQMTSIAKAFCQKISSAGYQTGLYANAAFLKQNVDASAISAQYQIWLAHWTNQTDYAGDYTFWQYGTGKVDGISGSVDMNIMYTKPEQGSEEPTPSKPVVEGTLTYQAHVQDIGWQDAVTEKKTAGTSGKSKRMEALKITLPESLSSYGGISYRAHVQDIGWQKNVASGQIAGTVGKSKAMEAIEISLTGNLAKEYDIHYRAHVANIGWQPWKKNGELAGTTGRNLRMEAIEIYITKKTSEVTPEPEPEEKIDLSQVTYQAKIKTNGWTTAAKNGYMAGTTGKSLRMEALTITLPSSMTKIGNISLSAHVSNVGWQKAVSSGQTAGVTNGSQQIEAVKISLTGTLAKKYDIYYHVHAAHVGWMGWAKNGEISGTTGLNKAVEAIQILIVEKGSASAPKRNSTINAIACATSDLYYEQYKPVFYSQMDSRWANNYLNYRFGGSGCSPSSSAMIISGITGKTVTPWDVGSYLYYNTMEYNRICMGSTGLAKKYALEHWGLKTTGIATYSQLVAELKKGRPVTIAMNPGIFISKGFTHAIVLWGYSSGKTNVYDPLGGAHNGTYSVSTIWEQKSTDKNPTTGDWKGGYVAYSAYK